MLDALRDADAVLCEDTRRTQILLDRYEIRARRLVSVHRHNEARRVAELLPRLSAGETHALVSDAGLPGVNDPGARLVEAAIAEGIPVTVLPGPSAVETALVASGLAAAAVPLPRLPAASRRGARRALGASLGPGRTPRSRSSRRGACRARSPASRSVDPDRPVAVCRELTKLHEEVVRGTASELAARFSEPPRGEVTVVVAAGLERGGSLDEAVDAVDDLVDAGASRRAAVDVVARLARVSRNELYRTSHARPD